MTYSKISSKTVLKFVCDELERARRLGMELYAERLEELCKEFDKEVWLGNYDRALSIFLYAASRYAFNADDIGDELKELIRLACRQLRTKFVPAICFYV